MIFRFFDPQELAVTTRRDSTAIGQSPITFRCRSLPLPWRSIVVFSSPHFSNNQTVAYKCERVCTLDLGRVFFFSLISASHKRRYRQVSAVTLVRVRTCTLIEAFNHDTCSVSIFFNNNKYIISLASYHPPHGRAGDVIAKYLLSTW